MSAGKGLQLSSSQELKGLLSSAAVNESLDQNIREEAKKLSEEERVTWRQLRPIYNAVRGLRQQNGQGVEDALKGCKMVIPERAEKTKSPELLARLAKLQRQEDDRKYNAMVADITKAERRAEAAAEGQFASYSEQLAYGVQIIVVMGVAYLLGHLAASSLSSKPAMRAVGGLTGLVIGMLVEAVLLIIRTSEMSAKQRRKKSKYLSTQPAAANTTSTLQKKGSGETAGVKHSKMQKQL